nr:uncharacterized protein LOC129258727 [Lytechinus pictus]
MEERKEMVTMGTRLSDDGNQVKHDPHRIVLCVPCNLWFVSVLEFIRHHSQHEIQEEVQCLLCRQSFKGNVHLVDHYSNFHNIEEPRETSALLDSSDRDQKMHVDHSYSRAENGDRRETDVEEKEGLTRDGGASEMKTEKGEAIEEMEMGEVETEHTVGGTETPDMAEGDAGNALKGGVFGSEAEIKRTCEEWDKEDCTDVFRIKSEKMADAKDLSVRPDVGDLDMSDKENNDVDLEDSGSGSSCMDTGLLDNAASKPHTDVVEAKTEVDGEEEYDVQNTEVSEDCLQGRLSPFSKLQGDTTLDSIHSDHLEENDDSNTFMEQIHLETGDKFEGNLSDGDDDHEEEAPLSDGEALEVMPEYEEGDFRFISGLRHRQIHIANSNMVTDIGMQVFICLHCDFLDSEAGLVNHMKKIHEKILAMEYTMLQFSREVPVDRVFPENVTGEEVMMLSEYHKRNLQQKHLSGGSRKRSFRSDVVEGKRRHACIKKGGTVEKKKRYVENRVPSLCPECGKILCRKSALRTHILGVHSRSRNHLCEVCGKAFRASYHLSQHRKSHRTKTFSCDLCDFTSDVRMDIFDHQQLHPNNFILCHVCGTVLKSKTALKRHMMVHSDARPFACTVEGCTWRFTSEALCKGHIEAHNSPGEFICLECKRRFRKRHHVRRHLKTVHGKESNVEADKFIAVDAKEMPSAEQFDQIPVTQLSKQHIVITTDEHGTPIFCDQNEELVFDSKTSSLLQVTVKHSDEI